MNSPAGLERLMARTVSIHNLGCKVNSYEADAVLKLLEAAGYGIVPFTEKADVVIINTCTVTAVADKKSRQMLHRAKKLNPDAVVIAMGCYAETGKEKLADDAGVDLVIGNNRKKEIVPILEAWFAGEKKKEWFADIAHSRAYEAIRAAGTGGHTRAFVKVQDGCDQFCSYCIIPYARGRSRSREVSDVAEEVRQLAGEGIKEIVLTGIHLTSYGKGLDTDLAGLIEAVHDIPGPERIRLGSLEAGIVTEDFVRRIRALPKVCPHFHLSLQSGCDATLKRMNRHYTTQEYAEKCALIREYYERPALTTDVIAGFPGETEEEFEQSYSFVESIGFFETHIFPYSRREGTAAAKLPDQVPETVKKERVARLLELNARQTERYLESGRGRSVPVLFEEEEQIDGVRYWTGHTCRYEKVRIASDEDLRNQIRSVRL